MKDVLVTTTSQTISLKLADNSGHTIMKNLLSLYLHDLSKYMDDLELNEQGLYEYDGLYLYFEKNDLLPYFIMLDDKVIGFMLLSLPPFAPCDADFYVNEIFILKKYRRHGYGSQAVHHIFKRYKGNYFIFQSQKNKEAIDFWKKTLNQADIQYEEMIKDIDGERCLVQIFDIS
ncbi:GNAT family N-acetyltransferase [Longirhabdus pacifica]|uniref:GNAT family N-acetyltransferase n=1 Tax=Longirhabdus pacifica TaxID=2305227 RepID=UPI00100880AE|nr:GNAT family N-acetyltransferase [Longirhabdus pacifica]